MVLRVEFNVGMLGVPGQAYAGLNVAKVDARSTLQLTPEPGWNVSLGAAVTGDVGLRMKLLRIVDFDMSTSHEFARRTLEKFIPFDGQAEIEVQ